MDSLFSLCETNSANVTRIATGTDAGTAAGTGAGAAAGTVAGTPASPTTVAGIVRQQSSMKVGAFLKQFISDKAAGKSLGKIDYKWQKRTGFNEKFNCNSKSKDGNFKATDGLTKEIVVQALMFDLILAKAYERVANHTNLDQVQKNLCDAMFAPNADEMRMVKMLNFFDNISTDVVFLNEIPKWWLVDTGSDGAFKKKASTIFHIKYAAANLDKDDNSVVLLRKTKFATVSDNVTFVGDANAVIAYATPTGLKEQVAFYGMHLSSKLNNLRENGVELLTQNKTEAIIAAADTNGEPRSKTYEKGKYFFESPLTNSQVHRATSAPWSKTTSNVKVTLTDPKELPAYGTCNKQRTAMQAQLRKAGQQDRLMKDNIYYKSGTTLQVSQIDLCSSGSCDKFTFGGKVNCNNSPPTPDEVAKVTPMMTCGYVDDTVSLPNTAEMWGISDHMAVSAKFTLH